MNTRTRSAIIIIGVLAVIAAGCAKESEHPVKQYLPDKIDNYTLVDSVQELIRENIYDYMDGAAEVYLSYDFQQGYVFRYSGPENNDIIVEIFDMNDPSEAYGVFSHTREEEPGDIGGGSISSGGLICFWQNKYYICIRSESGTDEEAATVERIARAISNNLPQESPKPELLQVLPETGLIPETIRYFHLHSTLNYHYFISEYNLLNMGLRTDVVMAAYEPGTVYLVCIKYEDEFSAEEGYTGFIEEYIPEGEETGFAEVVKNQWIAIENTGKYNIIILEALSRDRAEILIEGCKEKIQSLDKKEG